MLKYLAVILVLLAALGIWLTRPVSLDAGAVEGLVANPANGELLFHASSCSACHEDDLRGGMRLESPYGTFVVPNISPDMETGIGAWSAQVFANAMLRGVSPEGRHYYPAFPYTSYTRMSVQDTLDLKAYMDGLPAVHNTVDQHELSFPWNIRRGIGLWKRLYLDSSPHLQLPADTEPQLARGRYLVEGPGHCAECHTPRNTMGGLVSTRWMGGAQSLEGEGRVPNITPSGDGLGDWSKADLVYYLETGFTPEFDTVGGAMVPVQENLARLDAADREAIVVYLRSLPGLPSEEK